MSDLLRIIMDNIAIVIEISINEVRNFRSSYIILLINFGQNILISFMIFIALSVLIIIVISSRGRL